MNKKIIIAITGASGAIYGVRMVEIMSKLNIESHLIISKAANLTISMETTYSNEILRNMASYSYNPNDIAASIASGSFKIDGMIVVPCSMKTLSAIANGYEDNLIARAANVTLKEQRKLVLMPRETPLSAIYLENMLKLSLAGASICPPMPAFYNNPKSLDDIINHTISRIFDQFGIDTNLVKRWNGGK